MILYLSKTNANGVTTVLHQLDSISIRGSQMRCFFESYTDENKLVNKKSAGSQSFNFEIDNNAFNENVGLYQIIFDKVTSTTGWENAVLYTLTTASEA